MSDTKRDDTPSTSARATPLGIYDRPRGDAITSVEIVAGVLSVAWVVVSVILFVALPDNTGDAGLAQMGRVMVGIVIFLPLAMIWVAAVVVRATRLMRDESQRLQAAIDAIRQTYIAQNQGKTMGGDVSIVRKLEEIAAATRKTETAIATFTSSRAETGRADTVPVAPAQPAVEEQPVLALGTPIEDTRIPLSSEDFLRAMNFPETADDEEGFDALRRALQDRSVSQLIQAAEDVLTLMSQDGIYVDDLTPDRARPEVWRHFAEGGRGKSISALGGVRDRSSLALTAGRMKQDPIFRDAAHHFLRKYDQIVSHFISEATDAEIAALADTRSSRAFMLLGRVAGTFD